MPSPAERAATPDVGARDTASSVAIGATGDAAPHRQRTSAQRSAVEWALRALALALLAWALWRSIAPADANESTATASAATLHEALRRWSTVTSPATVHVRLDSAPQASDRDWLAALPGAGTAVTWDRGVLDAVAASVAPIPDPTGATRVRVAAPAGATVVVRDAVGVLGDAVGRPGGAGASFTVPFAPGSVDAKVGHTTARAVVADSLLLKRLLVLGRVGWEARFVIDALEERGWRVDADLGLAPHNDVVQGPPGSIDTSRYAAVIAIDSSVAVEAGRLVTYVQSGGGLVLAGTAADVPALRSVAPGAAGTPIRAGVLGPSDTLPASARSALGLRPVVALRPDAVVLETDRGRGGRAGIVSVAARRVGTGRVVQVGYEETWRWRMLAADGAAAHRSWWADIVSGVAYAPRVPRAQRSMPADPAPVARLVDAFGPPAASFVAPGGPNASWWRAWIFAGIAVALLLEWASRRTRGAR